MLSSLSYWITSFVNFSTCISQWIGNTLSLSSCEFLFVLPLFLSDNLDRYRILCWQLFLPCFPSSIDEKGWQMRCHLMRTLLITQFFFFVFMHSLWIFSLFFELYSFITMFWCRLKEMWADSFFPSSIERFITCFVSENSHSFLLWIFSFLCSLCSFLTSGTFTRYTLLDIFLFVLFIFYLSDLSSILSSFVPNLLFNPYTEFF